MTLFKDKIFLKSMLAIAVPIALQNLITSSVNMVDTLMITSLGKTTIAAVGLANQVFFLYILLIYGINSGSSIFIAQYWGKEDISSIRKILGLALTLSIITGALFTIAAFFFPSYIMGLLIQDKEVIEIGSRYLKVVSISYISTAISFAYSVALRTTGRPNVPMKISIITFLTNTVFNYILIFGKLGLPAMGVVGAAIGTIIARSVEFIFILYSVYYPKGILAAGLKELLTWDKEFTKRYIKTTYPVIFAEGSWSLGQVMYAVAYAKLGEEATAAYQVANTVQNIFFVLIRGVGNACTVMVGNKIGSGDEEGSYEYAKNFMIISTLLGLVLGTIQALTPKLTLILFRGLDPSLFETTRRLLVMMGLTFAIRVYSQNAVVGVLRGGGDTTFAAIIDAGSVWFIGVPLAFIGALIFELPIYYLYALVTLEELAKVIILTPRMLSKKWIKNVM